MRALLLAVLVFCPALHAQDFSELDAAAGQSLFERNWVQAPASTSAADGLGPYYNARSCAACHAEGGAGDGSLATMNLIVDDPVYGELLQLRAITGMKAEADARLSYEPAEEITLGDGSRVQLHAPRVALSGMQYGELQGHVALRRAPALGGLALLEQVPRSALLPLADPADRNRDGISGVLPADGGRFGWKARAATLREHTARALSLDLGVGSSVLPAAGGDCTEWQAACVEAARAVTGDKLEAPDTVLDLLVAYLQALPPPSAPDGAMGAGVFTGLGCPACHLPRLRTAKGQTLFAYTDMLLHDLGPGLASGSDPASAAEWRTAPLWGLGQNSRFLHDGRAATVEEAVLWHGGEAETARDAYRNLNSAQRSVLHDWLLGL